MEIIIAEPIGYCYGVERALNITYEALKSKSDNIYTLGPIIILTFFLMTSGSSLR
ncbi:unnamed protein product [marine sediment metagenome]|uniref:4-hydroxy-3-methylbut-2-enyl diphosphate reductase n=1 Tax=marine sediment metagenome TaxID=412755 RepID=X0YS95_9ZZZZ